MYLLSSRRLAGCSAYLNWTYLRVSESRQLGSVREAGHKGHAPHMPHPLPGTRDTSSWQPAETQEQAETHQTPKDLGSRLHSGFCSMLLGEANNISHLKVRGKETDSPLLRRGLAKAHGKEHSYRKGWRPGANDVLLPGIDNNGILPISSQSIFTVIFSFNFSTRPREQSRYSYSYCSEEKKANLENLSN